MIDGDWGTYEQKESGLTFYCKFCEVTITKGIETISCVGDISQHEENCEHPYLNN